MPRASRRYPLRLQAAVSDFAGRRRPASLVKHNGRYIVTAATADIWDDEPVDESSHSVPDDAARAADRGRRFDALARSARFSDTELRTIRAIAFDHFTFAQLARLDGCSRQVVLARVWDNSRHQGGLASARPGRNSERAGSILAIGRPEVLEIVTEIK